MDTLSVAVAIVAGFLLSLGVLSVVHMVFVRYVMGESTIWQTEFTTFAITASMLLGTPYVLKTGGHVAVTVLPDALHGLPKRLMRISASLVGLAFCLALAYGCWYYFYEAYAFDWTTGTVWNPPLWPAILPVAVGASLLSLQYVAEILRVEL
ncbi:TRAP-type C4-dicarboxylate transport system, small permease component [Marinobacter gudaonensis]|uniref:TRAP transporter small permease protein n=2 Tax=Marinobacter gudaonensis TaxID=375760 RepID=A0A1I6HTS7_9GAMM|nr:TRAP-type C4-dicarboxylate transport system, small permease component [Marinobacter gudaonensis]